MRPGECLLYALPGNENFATRLSDVTGIPREALHARRFPDGETYVRLDGDPRDREVLIVATQRHPDQQFLPLAFAADAARDLGARRVGLVAPYLAYLRQDRRFARGEAITAQSFARHLALTVDWLVTVDPHLHRLTSLAEVYDIPAQALDVAPQIADWIRANVQRPLIVGPDAESEQWTRAVADSVGAPLVVLRKVRRGDSDVTVSLPPDIRASARQPVIVDDIISTGQTIVAAARALRDAGFGRPACVAVHPLFAGTAAEDLHAAGIEPVATCNTIAHPTATIDVSGAIASALLREGPPARWRTRRTPSPA